MSKDVSLSFVSHFGVLNDPRIDRTKLYPLTEILFIVLAGSICGAESWRDFVLFGNAKLNFLRQYFSFSNGIPSKSTFARIFAMLDPEEFKVQFIEWVKTLQNLLSEVIAIDGKTLCNSLDLENSSSAIHMVSAFATQARLVLAQQKVNEKSNEITAIPKLLDLLDLNGHIVTIDAMGTQKLIANAMLNFSRNHTSPGPWASPSHIITHKSSRSPLPQAGEVDAQRRVRVFPGTGLSSARI
jgi:DDE_Tnp_1-associated/Transposase DDE domain